MTAKRRPVVRLLGTGGTISSVGHGPMDFTEYGIPGQRLSVDDLLARLPKIDGFPLVEGEQVLQSGSTNIGPAEWLTLARRINEILRTEPRVAGVALTHGTSALEETAYFLNLTVKSEKPVVVTGSMRPPSAVSPDGDINLIDAVRIAAAPNARRMGVLTILNNEVQAARDVTKQNTYRVDTFGSGPLGLLGYADSDSQIVFYRAPLRKHTYQTEFDVGGLTGLPRVDLAYNYAGDDGTLIRAAVAAGARGIVSAGSGAGSVTSGHQRALDEAKERGVAVVVSSQVGSGRVVMTRRREEQGLLVSDNLSPKKARILLMLGLTVTQDYRALQEMFYTY